MASHTQHVLLGSQAVLARAMAQATTERGKQQKRRPGHLFRLPPGTGGHLFSLLLRVVESEMTLFTALAMAATRAGSISFGARSA